MGMAVMPTAAVDAKALLTARCAAQTGSLLVWMGYCATSLSSPGSRALARTHANENA
jgi:hypothetical protein